MFIEENNQANTAYLQQLAHISMSHAAKDLMSPDTKNESLVFKLLDNHCFSDAIMYLAHVLPFSKALIWACESVRANSNGQESEQEKYMLKVAENWLQHKNEVDRDQLLPNQAISISTATSWLAMAVYWAGGSIVANDVQPKAAPAGLVNSAIYSAVMLSIFNHSESERETLFKNTIQNALDIDATQH